MKLPYTITICNLGLAFVITLVLSVVGLRGSDGIYLFGAVCSVGGIADLLISGVLFLCNTMEWGKGFLISAGMFLLIGLGICGPMLIR